MKFRAPSAAPELTLKDLSYTKIKTTKLCPQKAKFLYIDGLKEPENDAIKRGNAVHQLFEDVIVGRVKKVTKEFEFYQEFLAQLKKAKAYPEAAWAFVRESWLETKWTGVAGVWRMKIDAHLVDGKEGYAWDWKTGKKRNTPPEEARDQNELYAMCMFLKYPNLDTVHSELVYVDEHEVYAETFHRKDFAKMQKRWNSEDSAIAKRTTWNEKPNHLCKWCHFRASNDGPCKLG